MLERCEELNGGREERVELSVGTVERRVRLRPDGSSHLNIRLVERREQLDRSRRSSFFALPGVHPLFFDV